MRKITKQFSVKTTAFAVAALSAATLVGATKVATAGEAGPTENALPAIESELSTLSSELGLEVEAGSEQLALTGNILKVGPGQKYAKPSAAAAAAKDGDTIQIYPGSYAGDLALWKANNLLIKGVNGRPVIDGAGKTYGDKGIWVTRGNNITIENIEFKNAKSSGHNGAGIKALGANLTVRKSYFHHNENGIHGSDNANSHVIIENSHFANNGYGDGYTHAVYINTVKRVTFRYNYVHATNNGHHFKSRSLENYVLYNKLVDEGSGNSAYNIDMPEGHIGVVVGNVLQQSKNTSNKIIVNFMQPVVMSGAKLYVVNNTFHSQSPGVAVKNRGKLTGQMINNVFVGTNLTVEGSLSQKATVKVPASYFANVGGYDYHLKSGASAINAGVDPGMYGTFSLKPQKEYVDTANSKTRTISGAVDAGAFEYR